MFAILGWILFGGFVGWLAKLIYPGNENFTFFQTVGLGVLGSFTGGTISMLVFGSEFGASGLIMSVFGSVALLAAWAKKDEIMGFFRKKE